jgi:hypothetical protein
MRFYDSARQDANHGVFERLNGDDVYERWGNLFGIMTPNVKTRAFLTARESVWTATIHGYGFGTVGPPAEVSSFAAHQCS